METGGVVEWSNSFLEWVYPTIEPIRPAGQLESRGKPGRYKVGLQREGLERAYPVQRVETLYSSISDKTRERVGSGVVQRGSRSMQVGFDDELQYEDFQCHSEERKAIQCIPGFHREYCFKAYEAWKKKKDNHP